MTKIFQLDPRLAEDGATILDLELCQVLLVNNALFPWVMLVPKRAKVREIIDLNKNDRALLMEEITLVSEAMIEIFSPDKLNVAALGNMVPQLHVHIIARYINDSAWPAPVFGKGKEIYEKGKYQSILEQLKKTISAKPRS